MTTTTPTLFVFRVTWQHFIKFCKYMSDMNVIKATATPQKFWNNPYVDLNILFWTLLITTLLLKIYFTIPPTLPTWISIPFWITVLFNFFDWVGLSFFWWTKLLEWISLGFFMFSFSGLFSFFLLELARVLWAMFWEESIIQVKTILQLPASKLYFKIKLICK